MRGTLGSLGNEIVGVCFEADDEGKGLGVLIIEFKCACFNEVSLAFSRSMLACKIPAISDSLSSGISVRVKIEIANLPEILNKMGFTLVAAATFKDPTIYCWQYGHKDS